MSLNRRGVNRKNKGARNWLLYFLNPIYLALGMVSINPIILYFNMPLGTDRSVRNIILEILIKEKEPSSRSFISSVRKKTEKAISQIWFLIPIFSIPSFLSSDIIEFKFVLSKEMNV